MVLALANTLEGGTEGTSITTGNSGGKSGSAFSGTFGTAPKYRAASARYGQFGIKVAPAAAASYAYWTAPNVSGDTYYARFNFRINGTIPSSTIIWAKGGSISYIRINDAGGGHIRAQAGSSGTVGSVATITAGTWYQFQVYTIVSATVGQTIVRVYDDTGALLETITSPATGNTASGTTIGFGNPNSSSVDMDYDNPALSDQTWPGLYVPPSSPASLLGIL